MGRLTKMLLMTKKKFSMVFISHHMPIPSIIATLVHFPQRRIWIRAVGVSSRQCHHEQKQQFLHFVGVLG